MKLLTILSTAACALAQSGLNPPALGPMLDRQANLRPVFGIAGTAMAGNVAQTGVQSFACSASLCATKTDGAIFVGSQCVAAPAGGATIAVDGKSAFFYFAGANQLSAWNNGSLETVPVDPASLRGVSGGVLSGDVLSLAAGASGSLNVAVRGEDGHARIVEVDLSSGAAKVTGLIPGESGPVMLLSNGVLLVSREGVMLARADGAQVTFPIAQAQQFFAMSDAWVEVVTPSAHWAVRVTPGQEQAMMLPEVSQ